MTGNKHSGRRPKPTALRVLEGNRGHRPLNENEPKPRADMPEPPAFLDDYALEEWNKQAAELYQIGVLTVIDGTMLAAYCTCYSRWRMAEEALAREGRTSNRTKHRGTVLKTKAGNDIQNPLLGIANTARTAMMRIATEFGLTPSSRANIESDRRGEENRTAKKFGLG